MSKTAKTTIFCAIFAAGVFIVLVSLPEKRDGPKRQSIEKSATLTESQASLSVSHTPSAEPLSVPPATGFGEIHAPALLSAEHLTGTSWQQGRVTMRFLDDGRWEMNGRICARWLVEGDLIKLYNDELNEVHYIDIVDGTLSFNGEKISRVNYK
jgi:hypothetical protein